MVAVFSQAEAKTDLFKICRDVRNDERIACVKDKAGQRFMTLCPTSKSIRGPIVDVTVTRFKAEFSKFSTLVRLGLTFRVSMKTGEVFVRKHTSYVDPLQDVLVSWQNQVINLALKESEAGDVRRALHGLGTTQEVIGERVEKLIQGVARLSIGHRPFEEGQLDA
jgi:hypothetical protein